MEPIIDIQVQAVHWLRGYPSTIIIDRLEFVLNHGNFQRQINEKVPSWPYLELPKMNKMFVINYQNVWRRAVIKFYEEETNKCVLQLVDSSVVVDFIRNKYKIKSIEDENIMNEPWGRYKCYLYGIEFQKPPFKSEMIEMFDNFFANCQLRAILMSHPQKSEHMRKIFLCDFIKDTPSGLQSFREMVIKAEYATSRYDDQLVNIRLNDTVQAILVNNITTEPDLILRPLTAASSLSTSTLIATEIFVPPSTQRELDCVDFSNVTINEIIRSPEIEEHITISKAKKIGEGAFGTVLKGTFIATNTQVAVKKIVVPFAEISLHRSTIVSEVNILRTLKHENIISLKGVYVDFKNCTSSIDTYLCFDLAVTDLSKFIYVGSSLSPGMIMSATQMILRGMVHMHGKGIVHRDIKPENMLVFANGNVKICDFGLAIAKSDPNWNNRYTCLGTRQYMAPEMLLESYQYDCPIDMWGVGCCVLEMANGSLSFGPDKRVWDDQLKYIFSIFGTPNRYDWPELYEYLPNLKKRPGRGIRNVLSGHPQLFGLAEGLLQLAPSKRYTARDALDDSFFWLTPEEVLT